jgi:hypothetical protein
MDKPDRCDLTKCDERACAFLIKENQAAVSQVADGRGG